MAIQFPDFLRVPVRTPDYSGISDIFENYYAGKAMPKDDLIKAIQAEFARPNAEQALLASKLSNQGAGLSNRKSQLEIQKMAEELAEKAAFEKMFKQALTGNSGTMPEIPSSNRVNNIPYSSNQMNIPRNENISEDGIDQTKMEPRFRKFDQMATGLPLSAYTGKEIDANKYLATNSQINPYISKNLTGNSEGQYQLQTPQQQSTQQPEINETVINKGSPHLAGVDILYESTPRFREYLEKKGYKKKQEVKFDNKTGRTTVMTTYPSGKITLQTLGGNTAVSSDNIPLTTKSMNDAVKQVRATDAVMPYIDELIRMGEKGELPHFSYLPTDANATYHRVASEALDKYMVATGLNATDKSLDTIRDILFRSYGESTANYIKGLKKAKANKEKERISNIKMINQGLAKNVSFEPSSDDKEKYSSNEWEAV